MVGEVLACFARKQKNTLLPSLYCHLIQCSLIQASLFFFLQMSRRFLSFLFILKSPFFVKHGDQGPPLPAPHNLLGPHSQHSECRGPPEKSAHYEVDLTFLYPNCVFFPFPYLCFPMCVSARVSVCVLIYLSVCVHSNNVYVFAN